MKRGVLMQPVEDEDDQDELVQADVKEVEASE